MSIATRLDKQADANADTGDTGERTEEARIEACDRFFFVFRDKAECRLGDSDNGASTKQRSHCRVWTATAALRQYSAGRGSEHHHSARSISVRFGLENSPHDTSLPNDGVGDDHALLCCPCLFAPRNAHVGF